MTHSDIPIEPDSIADPYTRSLAKVDRRLQCIRAIGFLLTRCSAPDTDYVQAGCGAIILSEAHAMMDEIDTLREMEVRTLS